MTRQATKTYFEIIICTETDEKQKIIVYIGLNLAKMIRVGLYDSYNVQMHTSFHSSVKVWDYLGRN